MYILITCLDYWGIEQNEKPDSFIETNKEENIESYLCFRRWTFSQWHQISYTTALGKKRQANDHSRSTSSGGEENVNQ